jgi:hypothetical protein
MRFEATTPILSLAESVSVTMGLVVKLAPLLMRFVPVGGELIRDRNRELVTTELDRLSRFEPGPEGVFSNFAPRAFKQSTPDFLRRQIHVC